MEQNRVLLFDTALYTTNQGDEIIYQAVKDGMKDILDHYSVLRLATHVPNFSWFQMRKPNKKTRTFLDTKLKFICGTNLLAPQLYWRNYHAQWQLFNYNKEIYKDSVLIGVGLMDYDKETDDYTKKLLNYVISDQYIHSVRDERTKAFVESIGKRAINTGCPTLWGLSAEHCRSIPKNKAENCVVSVSGYKKQRDEKNDRILLDTAARCYKEKYIWIQTERDEEYLNLLEEDHSKFKRIYSLNHYSEVLSSGNIDYVGTRLHGGVFALMHGVRSLVVSIDERARGFHESNNLPVIEREHLSDQLESMICSDWVTEIRNNDKAIQEFKSQF